MRNLQEQVEKTLCYQKLFWPLPVWINCFSDLKNFENSRPSVSNFKSFSRSLEQSFLTVGQNNFGNKIPFLISSRKSFVEKIFLIRCFKKSGFSKFIMKKTFRKLYIHVLVFWLSELKKAFFLSFYMYEYTVVLVYALRA